MHKYLSQHYILIQPKIKGKNKPKFNIQFEGLNIEYPILQDVFHRYFPLEIPYPLCQ